ncbi:MAG: MarR family transcriptional regulator [Cycloclasticus sp.]|nr:MarR family transcriptional regulator [Cycloclasticus sp.]
MVLKKDTLGFLLADVSRLMRRQFNQHIEGSSLTLAQARALVYVSRHEGIRQSKLADMLEILPITLTRLIDQLVEAGLVDRRADPLDRRAYQIYLTTQAPTHLVAIEQVIELIQAEALSGLAESQLDIMLITLKKMRLNLGCSSKGRKGDSLGGNNS